MFYFRINKLRIIDNMERPRILGIFGRDLAQVKLVSFVTTDNMPLPDMSGFIHAPDWQSKKQLLKNAVSDIVNSRILTTIQNVKDNHLMYFGDTGYVLYQSEGIPNHFDWQLIAYESDRNWAEAGEMTKSIVNDSGFDNFAEHLTGIVKQAKNPAYMAAVAIGKYAVKVIADLVRQNKDDMIGIIYMSLNRLEHYPHGERKKNNVPDLTNNMYVDYSIFGFE